LSSEKKSFAPRSCLAEGVVVAGDEAVPRAVAGVEGGVLVGADGGADLGDRHVGPGQAGVGVLEQLDVLGDGAEAGHDAAPAAGEVEGGAVAELVVVVGVGEAEHLLRGDERHDRLGVDDVVAHAGLIVRGDQRQAEGHDDAVDELDLAVDREAAG
jgi:hypothetical protein